MSSNLFIITPEFYSHKMFSEIIGYAKELAKTGFHLRTVPGAGIVCALISVIFWSTAGLCIKLSDDVHVLEVLTIR